MTSQFTFSSCNYSIELPISSVYIFLPSILSNQTFIIGSHLSLSLVNALHFPSCRRLRYADLTYKIKKKRTKSKLKIMTTRASKRAAEAATTVELSNKQQKIDTKLQSELVSTLTCPICFEYMRKQIYQCFNSHLICEECRYKVGCICSLRCGASQGRAHSLESLREYLKVPCQNQEYGCSEILPFLATEHVGCKYNSKPCPNAAAGCNVLLSNYSNEHKDCLYKPIHCMHCQHESITVPDVIDHLKTPKLCHYKTTIVNKSIKFGESGNCSIPIEEFKSAISTWQYHFIYQIKNRHFGVQVEFQMGKEYISIRCKELERDHCITKNASCFVQYALSHNGGSSTITLFGLDKNATSLYINTEAIQQHIDNKREGQKTLDLTFVFIE